MANSEALCLPISDEYRQSVHAQIPAKRAEKEARLDIVTEAEHRDAGLRSLYCRGQAAKVGAIEINCANLSG